MLIGFWDHNVRSYLFMSFLTDLVLVAQPRLDLHLGLGWMRLHRQYFWTEVRVRCRAFIPSDLILSNQVFWP